MISELTIRNFKNIRECESIELGRITILIGGNNSGKTNFLQALSLWGHIINEWKLESQNKEPDFKKTVNITRQELVSIPILETSDLWYNKFHYIGKDYIYINVEAKGINWRSPLEVKFIDPKQIGGYVNKTYNKQQILEMNIKKSLEYEIAYLPSMSGLKLEEERRELGAINKSLGQGDTANVLRNLCYRLYEKDKSNYKIFQEKMKLFFSIEISEPEFFSINGLITLSYSKIINGKQKIEFEICSLGRGALQTMLLFSFVLLNPKKVILMDEPDAHLEFINQYKIFGELCQLLQMNDSQLLVATHSEAILDNFKGKEFVKIVAFYPNKIINDPKYLRESLTRYSSFNYVNADLKKHIIFTEDNSDMYMLKAFAEKVNHKILQKWNELHFEYMGGNNVIKYRGKFQSLKGAVSELKGIMILDGDNKLRNDSQQDGLDIIYWKKYELENYMVFENVFCEWLDKELNKHTINKLFKDYDLLSNGIENENTLSALREKIKIEYSNLINTFKIQRKDIDTEKASDNFIKILFDNFIDNNSTILNSYNIYPPKKSEYYQLIQYLQPEQIDPEIVGKLDMIYDLYIQSTISTPPESSS